MLISLAWVVAAATPASAHGVSGVSATNYRTRLKVVTPVVEGVAVKVIETGSRLQLVNRTAREVTVLGYQDEPYLRVGPAGVFENRRSPATYLNSNRQGNAPIPSNADSSAKPEWKKISSGQVARWHDHRIHWMGKQDPPTVRRAPDRSHVVIPEWRVEMRQGSTSIEAKGDLVWVPAPSALPWMALAAGLFVAALVVGLRPWWARALAVLLGLLVVVDAFHAFGIAFAGVGSPGTKVARVLGGGFFSLVAWVVGGFGVWLLLRRKPDGLYLAAFAGVLVALFGGVADLAILARSQVPFALAPSLARLAVGVSIGLGLGVAVASVLVLRRTKPWTDPNSTVRVT